jgi:hypothetical protein
LVAEHVKARSWPFVQAAEAGHSVYYGPAAKGSGRSSTPLVHLGIRELQRWFSIMMLKDVRKR